MYYYAIKKIHNFLLYSLLLWPFDRKVIYLEWIFVSLTRHKWVQIIMIGQNDV